ncbi:hypothetical protein Q31b_35880 [Novipirellula aureliae]|uniref:Sulfotransferase domain protein n=1 Tax=Novipirellula aureliae TaxID=2527966 RepID=A0A5C6DSD2_9BACT|nr:sulfotransferase [Novipirellula aureliae]TWU40243.1 hypothetical protein Q31b_35880 [Novipirellula aureliae]
MTTTTKNKPSNKRLEASEDGTPSSLRIVCDDAATITLQAAESASEGKPALRKFSMTAYTGGAMRLGGWPHPVVVDLTGMRVARKSRPILKDHDRGSIVGHTDAFMVKGRENMKALYRHLHWSDWKTQHHIDHHLGRLVQRAYTGKPTDKEKIAVYTPDQWLVGQLPSRSNICGRVWEETRFFNDAKNADHSDAPFFAVLGPHRSGSSCIAMIMNHLGVHMGNELGGYEASGGEAKGLARVCEDVMRFPAADPSVSDDVITSRLKTWISQRKGEARRDHTVAGGKYPHLCRFVNHLHAGLGDSLRIISVERDIEASIRSLQNRSEKHRGQWFAANDEDCEVLQRSLHDHRDNFIAEHPEVPVFRIEFAELVTYPEEVIRNLIEFLGIEPTPDEIQSAIEHVNPDLRKFG